MPVEKLSKSDLDALSEIEQATYPDPWGRDMLSCAWTEPHCSGIKFTVSGEMCGYLITRTLPPELEILNIAVSQKFRRQGIARDMMTWVMAEGKQRGCTDVFLEVRPSNIAAIKLYEFFGFSAIHTRKKYYRDKEDAWVMGAKLA